MANITITIGSTFDANTLAGISQSLLKIGASLKQADKKTSLFARSMDKINKGSAKIGQAIAAFKSKGRLIAGVFQSLKAEANKPGSKIVDKKLFKSVSAQVVIFQKNMDGLQTRVRQLGLSFAASLLPEVDKLLPTVNRIFPVIKGFVVTMTGWVKANPKLAAGIVGVVGGLWLFAGPLKTLFQGISLVTGGIRLLGSAILANPIGLLIGGIVLAAGLIITHWDEVKGYLSSIWDTVTPYWESFSHWVGGIWDGITTGVIARWEKVKGFFSTIWDGVKTGWQGFIDWIGATWDKVTRPFKTLVELGKGGLHKVGSMFSGLFGAGNDTTVNQATREVSHSVTTNTLQTMLPAGISATAADHTSVQVNAPITINAAPGMDERRLAELVTESIRNYIHRGRIADRSLDGEWRN